MARRFTHAGCSCSRRDFLAKGMYGLGVGAEMAGRGPQPIADGLFVLCDFSAERFGVRVPGNHPALVRETDFMELSDSEVFLQFAPVSFDASTLEIWGPLLNGGKLVIPPPQALSLDQLGEQIRKHGVTTLWLTSGLFGLSFPKGRPAHGRDDSSVSPSQSA